MNAAVLDDNVTTYPSACGTYRTEVHAFRASEALLCVIDRDGGCQQHRFGTWVAVYWNEAGEQRVLNDGRVVAAPAEPKRRRRS